jgi:hypothetical protein
LDEEKKVILKCYECRDEIPGIFIEFRVKRFIFFTRHYFFHPICLLGEEKGKEAIQRYMEKVEEDEKNNVE